MRMLNGNTPEGWGEGLSAGATCKEALIGIVIPSEAEGSAASLRRKITRLRTNHRSLRSRVQKQPASGRDDNS
jgi:hypothetical protein